MDSDKNLNISDVIDAIEKTDPEFFGINEEKQNSVKMERYNIPQTGNEQKPYVEIVEQPAAKAIRFRYECEGRSAGSIPGVNSTSEKKSFPSIRIVGHRGKAQIIVSCVTRDGVQNGEKIRYKPHPHNLVGKDSCKGGICVMPVVVNSDLIIPFPNLGIQCVKKKDIEESLKAREKHNVDPFKTGFDHKRKATTIDLNAVRLCFQVFVPDAGRQPKMLDTVVSNPIYDKKSMTDLVIKKISHYSASVAGRLEMILLCEKVAKEDIQIRFFEEKDGELVWEDLAEFQASDVHHQTAIMFKSPPYKYQQVEDDISVFVELRRPSDGTTSEPIPFNLVPLGIDHNFSLKRKRQKFSENPRTIVKKHFQLEGQIFTPSNQLPSYEMIKVEPSDQAEAEHSKTPKLMPLKPPMHSQNNIRLQNFGPQLSQGQTASSNEPPKYNAMQPKLQNFEGHMPQRQAPSSNEPAMYNPSLDMKYQAQNSLVQQDMHLKQRLANPTLSQEQTASSNQAAMFNPQMNMQYQSQNVHQENYMKQPIADSSLGQSSFPNRVNMFNPQMNLQYQSQNSSARPGNYMQQLSSSSNAPQQMLNINYQGQMNSAPFGTMDVNNAVDGDSQQRCYDPLKMFEMNLSDSFQENLQLGSPINQQVTDANCTESEVGNVNLSDSFTRLANDTIQKITSLNNMYKGP